MSRWTVLAVGAGAQAVQSAAQHGLPALGPALRDAYALSLPQVGVALSALNWGLLATLLAWGALADRIGERVVIAAGLAGAAAAFGVAAFVPGYGWLLAALALAGALAAAAPAASTRAVMGWFERRERGFAMGIRQAAVPVGGGIAAAALPACVALGGLRAALLALAAASAVGAAAAWRWLAEALPVESPVPVSTRPSSPLRDSRVWRLSAGTSLLVGAQTAVLAFVVLFLHDDCGVATGAAACCLAAIQLGGAVARLVAGRRSDRSGRRMPLLCSLALANAALLGVAALLVDAPLAILAPVLLAAGVLALSWNGLAITVAAELGGRERAGVAVGLQTTGSRLLAIGAGIGFAALVAASSWRVGFAALALLALAGWWLLRPLSAAETPAAAPAAAWRRRAPRGARGSLGRT